MTLRPKKGKHRLVTTVHKPIQLEHMPLKQVSKKEKFKRRCRYGSREKKGQEKSEPLILLDLTEIRYLLILVLK